MTAFIHSPVHPPSTSLVRVDERCNFLLTKSLTYVLHVVNKALNMLKKYRNVGEGPDFKQFAQHLWAGGEQQRSQCYSCSGSTCWFPSHLFWTFDVCCNLSNLRRSSLCRCACSSVPAHVPRGGPPPCGPTAALLYTARFAIVLIGHLLLYLAF